MRDKSKQRLDSTHVLGLVARMRTLECVRESLRLALEQLGETLKEEHRPEFWNRLWERYVDSQQRLNLLGKQPVAVRLAKHLTATRLQPEQVRLGIKHG